MDFLAFCGCGARLAWLFVAEERRAEPVCTPTDSVRAGFVIPLTLAPPEGNLKPFDFQRHLSSHSRRAWVAPGRGPWRRRNDFRRRRVLCDSDGRDVVLARLLTPDDFGVVTMVTTFSLLFYSVGLNGFTEAILQREELHDSLASNLFLDQHRRRLAADSGICCPRAAVGALLSRYDCQARRRSHVLDHRRQQFLRDSFGASETRYALHQRLGQRHPRSRRLGGGCDHSRADGLGLLGAGRRQYCATTQHVHGGLGTCAAGLPARPAEFPALARL